MSVKIVVGKQEITICGFKHVFAAINWNLNVTNNDINININFLKEVAQA